MTTKAAKRTRFARANGGLTSVDVIGADVRDGTTGKRPLTELGNAHRLMDMHGNDIRYVPEVGAWLLWNDGWKWSVDGAEVRRLAYELRVNIYEEAEGPRNLLNSNRVVEWARKSQNNSVVRAAVEIFSDLSRVSVTQIDYASDVVGLNGGRHVIDLSTGSVRLASRADFVTRAVAVAEVGDPERAIRWQAFLREVFDDDDDLIGWVHRFCGYLLSGSTEEQFFVFCYGNGGNGKSVFCGLLQRILGDYARATSVETFTDKNRRAGQASPDLHALVAARLVVSSETEEGQNFAEAFLKTLTGGDRITARACYGKRVVEFVPQFKILLHGNHRPRIQGTDDGIWRRVRILPFKRRFDSRPDPHLLDKLKAEAPHILAWMVAGELKRRRDGLRDIPAAMAAQINEYRQDEDSVAMWLAECCETSAQETPAFMLHERYAQWCKAGGVAAMARAPFGKRLHALGYKARTSNGQRLYGLTIRADNVPTIILDAGLARK